jgi:hypothetical protein
VLVCAETVPLRDVDPTGERGEALTTINYPRGSRPRSTAKPAAMKRKIKPVPVPTEHEEQVRLFSIIDKYKGRYPDLECVAAVPNGLRTSMRTAVKAKAEGLKRGYPDIVVDVPRVVKISPAHARMCPGLRIELKRIRGGHVDPEQKEWHERLRSRGYRVEVCRGCDEAWRVICEYLGIEDMTISRSEA